jgi:hypothetical protein
MLIYKSPGAAPLHLPLRTPVCLSGSWEDDDEEDDTLLSPAVDAAIAAGIEFDKVFKRYRKRCGTIDWKTEFQGLDLPAPPVVLVPTDLLEVNVASLITKIMKEDPDRALYGYLPYMATHSRASLGTVLASSFAERINSGGSIIVTKGNTLLADEEIDICTTLRMNRGFMTFMRTHYCDISRQQFKMSVVTEEQNSKPDPDE